MSEIRGYRHYTIYTVLLYLPAFCDSTQDHTIVQGFEYVSDRTRHFLARSLDFRLSLQFLIALSPEQLLLSFSVKPGFVTIPFRHNSLLLALFKNLFLVLWSIRGRGYSSPVAVKSMLASCLKLSLYRAHSNFPAAPLLKAIYTQPICRSPYERSRSCFRHAAKRI